MTTVIIPEELERRLYAIAETKHMSVETLTTEMLKEYIEEQERYVREMSEDDARWQRYLRTGEALSREDMSRKLQNLAEQAAAKAR